MPCIIAVYVALFCDLSCQRNICVMCYFIYVQSYMRMHAKAIQSHAPHSHFHFIKFDSIITCIPLALACSNTSIVVSTSRVCATRCVSLDSVCTAAIRWVVPMRQGTVVWYALLVESWRASHMTHYKDHIEGT